MIFLGELRQAVRAASWFAALGEQLAESDLADAHAYADVREIVRVESWPKAEAFLKSPDTSLAWWNREESQGKALLVQAQTFHSERALWTSLSELTTEAGDLVHGAAARAAVRLGNAAVASVHVAAGAASQAVYQLALARIVGQESSPFEAKFRLFAAGRWPLGADSSRLMLF